MKYPLVKYKDKIKPDSWCRWSVNRVKNRNNSTNVRFVGDTGSGKSWSALYYCEKCSILQGRKFTPDWIFFSIRDVIKRVSEEEPKPGTVFFIDEQQIGASAKEHQSKRNKAYSAFMSTVRSNRYIIVTTLPFSDMEDKQLRRLFHVEMETCGVNQDRNTVTVKPRYLEHSRVKDKVYRKRLVVSYKDPITGLNKGTKINLWEVPKPSQEIIDKYEQMKKEFKRILYSKLNQELGDYESADQSKTIIEKDIKSNVPLTTKYTPYQQAILDCMNKGITKQKDIDNILKKQFNYSSTQKISVNLKSIRKKLNNL